MSFTLKPHIFKGTISHAKKKIFAAESPNDEGDHQIWAVEDILKNQPATDLT